MGVDSGLSDVDFLEVKMTEGMRVNFNPDVDASSLRFVLSTSHGSP